ncbi:winged helix-turn-helix transcriptional regulator [Carnobacteriaceae bacterium zg-C25]|nr:winged helix-turn-helix transcriptional regulator [Carnobacteriaceae bacterium zg-C25]
MNVIFNTKINYLNEALLLATYICNTSEEKDAELSIEYNKIGVSKATINQKNQEFIMFLKSIRFEARKLLKNFLGIDLLFQNFETHKTPEVVYFLTYSKFKQSIKEYSHIELFYKIKEDFIKNMQALGFDITEKFTFEELDKLSLFSEQQRYAIYKLIHNINGFFDDVYDLLLKLENIIKKHEHIIRENLKTLYSQMENINFMDINPEINLKSVIESYEIDYLETTVFLQFTEFYGFSVVFDNKNEKQGFLFLGAIPFLVYNEFKPISEEQDDMLTKFTLLSDMTRFNILILLSKRAMFGREISEKLSVSSGTISYHLSNLLQEKMINSEIRGKRIYYSINSLELNRMSLFLKHLGGNDYDQ